MRMRWKIFRIFTKDRNNKYSKLTAIINNIDTSSRNRTLDYVDERQNIISPGFSQNDLNQSEIYHNNNNSQPVDNDVKLLGCISISKAKCSLLGGFLLIASLVSAATMSNSGSYFFSYMVKYSPDGDTLDESNILWMGSWYSLSSGISSAIGGYIEFRYGSARQASILGAIIYSMSIISTKWTINYGYYFVLISYGILPGFGCGMAWTPAVINSFGWYPKSKGLASGVIMAGYGVGAFFFNYIITLIVNPDNLPANGTRFEQEEVLARVPNLFLKLGFTFLMLELVGCSLLFKPPASDTKDANEKEGADRQIHRDHDQMTTKNDLNNQLEQQQQQQQDQQEESHKPLIERGQLDDFDGQWRQIVMDNDSDRFPWSMVFSKQFIVLFVITALSAQTSVFLSSMQKQYGQTYIKDDHYLSRIGSISSLAICVGKIFWGYTSDKLSYVHCFTILNIIMFTTVLVLPYNFILSNEYMFASCILLASTSMIGYSVILNVKCYKTFGQRHATLMTGLTWIGSTFNIPTSLLIGYLFTNYDRYAPCFLLCLLTFLSEAILLLYVCYYKKKSWKS